MGKKAVVMLEGYAEKYNIIPGREYLYDWKSPLELNVFVALDCADIERLGSFRGFFEKAVTTVCIDHHETNNGFADYNYILADASSTAEMVFEVIEALSQKLPLPHITGQNSDTAIVGADLVSARACAKSKATQKPDVCTSYMLSGQTQGLPLQCTCCDLCVVGAGSSRPGLPEQNNIESSVMDISSGREDPAPTVCRVDDSGLSCASGAKEALAEAFLDQEIATCIYAGIIGDTGGFRYSSTSQKTMEIAAKLMATGIDFPYIYAEILHKHSFAAAKAFGMALANCESAADGRIVYTYLTREMLATAGADSSDMDNVVEYLMSTRGAEVAIFFYERHQQVKSDSPAPPATSPDEAKKIKVSMRSKGLHIGRIAAELGGGGHRMAAGCTVLGNIQDVMQDVLGRVVGVVEGEV